MPTYALVDPETNFPKYVGFSTNAQRRYNTHLKCHRVDRKQKREWIEGLKQKGLRPRLVILDIGNSEYEWMDILMSSGHHLLGIEQDYFRQQRPKSNTQWYLSWLQEETNYLYWLGEHPPRMVLASPMTASLWIPA